MIWKYPFRYFKELRDAYLTTLEVPRTADDDDGLDYRSSEAKERVIEFDRELFRGDAL